MTRRLFLALNATDPLAESFAPTLKKLKINADRRETHVKWVAPENYHVTVTFLGDRPESEIPEITAIVQKICAETAPFELKIEDVAAFSNEHDARVIYLGVQNKKCLGEFKAALDMSLSRADLLHHIDRRDFSPHLTVGRLKNPKSVKDMISPFKRKSFGKLYVDEIILYESKLQGVFAVYTPLARFKLSKFQFLEDEQRYCAF